MYRVLLDWRGIRVHSYPAMMYVGTVLGVVAARHAAERAGTDPVRVAVATLILFPLGLVGARLLFVAYHWTFFDRHRSRILRRDDGGAAVYGGLLLVVPASVPLLLLLGLGFGAFWDVASLTMLIGLIFTKVGCLLNGCCAGRVTTGRLALVLPDDAGVWLPRVPAQLLEAGAATLILAGAIAAWDRRPFPGAIFLGVVASYAVARILLDPTRATVDRIAGMSANRVVSVLLATLSLGAFALAWLGTHARS